MNYNRILTIQDISCVGQCSLTVALPILSACGQEAVILPSAVLSTHTGGFKNPTFRDLTDDIPSIVEHWQKEELLFDAIYTGYLGSLQEIQHISNIMNTLGGGACVKIIDPAMADHGKLYAHFDTDYAKAMTKLCIKADIILPNMTEVSLMTGLPYQETYDQAYVMQALKVLREIGMKTIILTGISYDSDTTGVVLYEGDEYRYFSHKKLPKSSHGTGDIFASAFTGAYLSGKSMFESIGIAAKFVLSCMENTQDDPSHWYGVKFEPMLGSLIEMVR